MTKTDSMSWLLEQRPEIHQVIVRGRDFYLRTPTVRDRDRFDAMVSTMDLETARLRSPLLEGLLCNRDGELVGGGIDFDEIPAELVEPLVDKARELYGITDHPTPGGTD